MRSKHLFLGVVLCFAIITAPGCVLSYRYLPVDSTGKLVQTWTESIHGVDFEVRECATFGSSSIYSTLYITNHSNRILVDNPEKDVVVLGGQLTVNGQTLEADVPDDLEKRIIAPQESDLIQLSCDLEKAGLAAEDLGRDIKWNWRVRIGDEEHLISVNMRQY